MNRSTPEQQHKYRLSESRAIFGHIVVIDYIDSAGKKTRRLITLSLIRSDRIYAYCHTRNAARCFVLTRIKAIIDPKTGEIHDDVVGYFARLISYAEQITLLGEKKNAEKKKNNRHRR